MRGISWLAEKLLASEEGLCSVDVASQLIIKITLCAEHEGYATMLRMFMTH
jgi:hypothetical protein